MDNESFHSLSTYLQLWKTGNCSRISQVSSASPRQIHLILLRMADLFLVFGPNHFRKVRHSFSHNSNVNSYEIIMFFCIKLREGKSEHRSRIISYLVPRKLPQRTAHIVRRKSPISLFFAFKIHLYIFNFQKQTKSGKKEGTPCQSVL